MFSASSVGSAVIGILAVLFFLLHLPFLPRSLEDLDSINFALGVRHFDVAHHQPHPPGYPVYIALAKITHALIPGEARALGVLSVVAGALGILAIGALFQRLGAAPRRGYVEDGLPSDSMIGWTSAATAVAMTSPLYYFTAARPLSDETGLAAAVAIQALTMKAMTTGTLAAAAFAAGLATGIRSQVAWLTVPLIMWRLFAATRFREQTGAQPATSHQSVATSNQIATTAAAFVAGALAWAVPLVVLSGGIVSYWHALFNQGAEDLGNIQMLWSHHGARDIVDAMYYAFVAPWAIWWVAAFVLAAASVGVWQLWLRQRWVLVWVAVAFGPYFIFDVLFQETFTSRYALPLVIPIAFLAVAGLRRLPREAALLLTLMLAMYDAHIGGTSIAAYASQQAPAFRLLADMKSAAATEPTIPALAPDRRESLDLRGPFKWLGDASPRVDRQLPAPPQREWLEAVKYWNAGGRAPVWFVVDPMRASIDLVQHDKPAAYRWSVPYPVLLSGVRPNEMDWYRVDRPEWYVAEGWALTPEAAGVAEANHRGLAYGPIEGWIGADVGSLLIGGRSFESRPEHLIIDVEGQEPLDLIAEPGSFIFPELQISRQARSRKMSLRAVLPGRVAIEQFDASATRRLLGFGAGWHEQEFNPTTGVRWRWLSERGHLSITSGAQPIRRSILHVEGESPLKYFSRASTLTARVGREATFDVRLSSDFSIDIPIGSESGDIVLETDQTYVPAERSLRRSADRRRLGLRIFKCEIRPAGVRP